jgi:hypothetical protein
VTRRYTSEIEVKQAYWDYLVACANVGDATVLDARNLLSQDAKSPTQNPLWQYDIRTAGCQLKLDLRNGDWVVDLVSKTHATTVHVLGRPGPALLALHHMTQAINLLTIDPNY